MVAHLTDEPADLSAGENSGILRYPQPDIRRTPGIFVYSLNAESWVSTDFSKRVVKL